MEAFRNTGLPDWDWWSRLWPTPGETLRDLGVTSDTTFAGSPRGPPADLRMTPEATEAAVTGVAVGDGVASEATVDDAAGFDLRRRVDLPPYHYAMVFER